MTSQINPNNIDATYPVAGQDNDSQGFRDNFTSIKTNFQYAAAEIGNLQLNSISANAVNNLGGGTLYNGYTRDMSEITVAIGPVSTGNTATLDFAASSYQTLYTTGGSGAVTLAFDNFASTGYTSRMRLQANITSTGHTLVLPSAVDVNNMGIQGLSGNTITFGDTGIYEFEFETSDGGGNISIFDLNRPLNVYTNPLFLTGSEDLANTANVSLTKTTSYFTTAAAETATLLDGSDGQIKVLAAVNVAAGDMVVTVSNAAWGGSGTATFDGNGQACTLQYVNSKWFCIGNNGVTFG